MSLIGSLPGSCVIIHAHVAASGPQRNVDGMKVFKRCEEVESFFRFLICCLYIISVRAGYDEICKRQNVDLV